MRKSLFAAVLIAFGTTAADASLVRFDFAGQILDTLPGSGGIAPSAISGFLILDTEAPDDRPGPDNARYVGAIVDAEVVWDGVALDFMPGTTFSDVFITNDSDIANDLFAPVVGLQDQSGALNLIGLQLGDITRTVFSDDSFPTSLSLSMFDSWQVDNANSTGIFISVFGGPNDGSYQGGFTFAELRALQVPGPGTVALCVAALLAWRAARPGWRR